MDARRLVGYSEGAKKRAARRDAVTAQPGGRATTRSRVTLRHLLAVFSACHIEGHPKTLRRYAEARALYRIGERLRPCRLCPKCRPDLRWEIRDGMARAHGEDCGRDFDGACRCAGPIRFVDDYCDGSGVLPTAHTPSTGTGEGK